jgi:hypothetical protein
MSLKHTRLCSESRCEELARHGIVTAGDLASADPADLVNRLGVSVKAVGVLRRYRRAIRLSASVPGMMPCDALLLISIHRRSIRGLALESSAALHRDLQRFALSTKGRRLLKGRRLPSVRRIRKWISVCQSIAKQAASIHAPTRSRQHARPQPGCVRAA